MAAEERLRELLGDPRWSLPPWTQAELHARVRRSAVRQRRRLARISAAVAVTVTTAAVLPAVALNGYPGGSPAGGTSRAPAAVQELALPAVGAAGFSVTVYPAARVPVRATAATPLCPASTGLQTPGQATAVTALQVLRGRVVSFTRALHQADRSYWTQLRGSWRRGITSVVPQVALQNVVYSGPLASFHGRAGPAGATGQAAPAPAAAPARVQLPARLAPDQSAGTARAQAAVVGHAPPAAARPPAIARVVAAGCGRAIVRYTWLIVSSGARVQRPGSPPARQVATLFLKRQGHVLLYNRL